MSSPFEKKFMLSLEENESERLGPSEDQARKFWAGSNRCTLQEVEFACTWFKLNLMSALENSGQESEKKKRRRRRRINKINKLKKRQESLRVSGFWFQLCDFFSLVATAIDNWRFALHHLQTTHHSRTWKFEFFFLHSKWAIPTLLYTRHDSWNCVLLLETLHSICHCLQQKKGKSQKRST